MKKGELLNQPISAVIAAMGHTDMLMIADAGLPIPASTQRIDLALTEGVPGFLETLRTIMTELEVESAVVAEEMTSRSPELYAAVLEILGDIPIEIFTHLILKEISRDAMAIVRTGEFTPYANIILRAGVVF